MMDALTKAQRSVLMSKVRGQGNRTTELALVKLLSKNKITGWRRHAALLGKPDFVFQKERVLLFVDGCFWHGCSKHLRIPANNRAYWKKKVMNNRMRDRTMNRKLRRSGWRVVRIWEHQLRNEKCVIQRIRHALGM